MLKNEFSKISQEVFLCEHTPIIAITNKKDIDVVNGEQFQVVSFEDDFVYAKRKLTDDELEEAEKKLKEEAEKIVKRKNNKKVLEVDRFKRISIPIKKFQCWFHVSYAITCHKSQGMTINYNYTIHEWEFMNKKSKYVSLTRGSKYEYVNLV